MRLTAVIAAVAAVLAASACARTVTPSPSATTTSTPATAAGTDTLGPVRQRAVAAVLQRITGRENAPAESVFQNVKILKGVPARQFLQIMNDGFGHGLGVSCGFCHVPGQFASDQRPNKNIARDMLGMVNRINTDLKGMTNLPDQNPMIGCITCHRSAAKPLLIERG